MIISLSLVPAQVGDGLFVEIESFAQFAKLRPGDDDFQRHAVLVEDDFLLDGNHGVTLAPPHGGGNGGVGSSWRALVTLPRDDVIRCLAGRGLAELAFVAFPAGDAVLAERETK